MGMRRVSLIIAASAVLACLLGVAVTQIDSGATSGPAAGEKAAASDPGSEGAATTTTAATVPETGPGASAPTTAPPPPPPVTSPTTDDQDGGEDPPIGNPPPPQVWSLPQGKLEVNDEFERLVYNAFVEGCDVGRAELEKRWGGLRSPRNDFLFTAALHVCRGDVDEGRRWFQQGALAYGGAYADWGGVGGSVPVCLTYKAVRSVLDNVSQGSVTCPAAVAVDGPRSGGGPPWCEGQGLVRPTTLDRIEPCPDEATSTETAGS
jgi:hypothetical protein